MEPTQCRRDRIRHQAMRDIRRALLRMIELRWFVTHAHQKSGASCTKTHSVELCLQIGSARQVGPVHRDSRTRTGGKLCTAIGQKNNGTCVANTLRAHCERFHRPCTTSEQTRNHPKTLLFINSGPTLSLFAVFHRPLVPSDARARGSTENAASSTSPREALIAFQTLGQSTTTHNLSRLNRIVSQTYHSSADIMGWQRSFAACTQANTLKGRRCACLCPSLGSALQKSFR